MNVGILSYYRINRLNKKSYKTPGVVENSLNGWHALIKEAKKNSIYFEEYTQKKHKNFDQILILEIPRLWEFIGIILNSISTITISNSLGIRTAIFYYFNNATIKNLRLLFNRAKTKRNCR